MQPGDCDCERLRVLVKNLETILAVLSLALGLLVPVAKLLQTRAVANVLRTIPGWQQLPRASKEAVEKIPDLSRIIEGEYTVIQEAGRTLFRAPGVIIKP